MWIDTPLIIGTSIQGFKNTEFPSMKKYSQKIGKVGIISTMQ